MESFLNAWLPRMLPENCTFTIHRYQGKHALLRKIADRLKGYERWMPAGYRIVIIVDRDEDECRKLKAKLERACKKAGLRTRRVVHSSNWQAATRIAIEELEAWYFGDWQAVRQAYPRIPENIPHQQRYRDPDAITGGTWERLEKIFQRSGYFKQGLAKIEIAKAIGQHIDPDPARNQSRSFAVFCDAINEAGRCW